MNNRFDFYVLAQIHRSLVLNASAFGKKFLILVGFVVGQFFLSVFAGGDRIGEFFFPASGNGNGTTWNNRGSNGNYWSASMNSTRNARNLNFNSGGVNPQNTNNRYNGFPVRPVQHLSTTVV